MFEPHSCDLAALSKREGRNDSSALFKSVGSECASPNGCKTLFAREFLFEAGECSDEGGIAMAIDGEHASNCGDAYMEGLSDDPRAFHKFCVLRFSLITFEEIEDEDERRLQSDAEGE
ncbi:uncharacterized protein MONOS_11393 [Monocercomonoides exilis]|uniref:uncharacterized protein n=1 Tax=Monocercomonoides exilis TaxID=2049356 RepID=UPI003559F045|nr:hypothetical protein MONOS_11393 [Monocercomonoides exilis]|eukprot:MONOS_11393.1-p1 / transcript=MONOS_11393.1 / gene=MONOS_11393 / organism=Monocercomonoides_exilis_PA203 / gene_product=unspecified product / transcript_product=unspecified product / location=Mono_scaffold00569:14214-14567(+) / protein_length=118 / sequence_SO=supercontig / SO=protein_coding / is_pseudo=false